VTKQYRAILENGELLQQQFEQIEIKPKKSWQKRWYYGYKKRVVINVVGWAALIFLCSLAIYSVSQLVSWLIEKSS
jgi:hypothetical protein